MKGISKMRRTGSYRIMKNYSHKVRIETDFDFNERVIIKPLEVEGTIESFWLNKAKELKVEVRYFLKDEIKLDYFYCDELAVLEEAKTGFSI